MPPSDGADGGPVGGPVGGPDVQSATRDTARLAALYQELILDHYRRPRNKGALEAPDEQVQIRNPLCGDEVELAMKFDGDTVADVRFSGKGCSISQASASVLTDLVIGKTVDEAMSVHETFLTLMQGKGTVEPDEDVLEDGIAFAGVAKFPARVKCALLSWMAWKDATARSLEAQS